MLFVVAVSKETRVSEYLKAYIGLSSAFFKKCTDNLQFHFSVEVINMRATPCSKNVFCLIRASRLYKIKIRVWCKTAKEEMNETFRNIKMRPNQCLFGVDMHINNY